MAANRRKMISLPDRPSDAHKGTFGTVVVIGGCTAMIGAPALAATAGLRSGAGLAKILTSADALPHCLTIEPSATGIAVPSLEDGDAVDAAIAGLGAGDGPRTVLAVGPGMGVSDGLAATVSRVLASGLPVVLDADGLNNLANLTGGESAGATPAHPTQHGPLVMTPHPGEFRRLAAAAGIAGDPADPDQRPDAANALAKHYGAIVVLKGHQTVVADGEHFYINGTGNPALATAGSGDVLTGLIAGLIAQGMSPFEGAVLGVFLHGLAADLWAKENGHAGLVARELAAYLPRAMKAHRG